MAQVVEHLPSKLKVLSLNSISANKTKTTNKKKTTVVLERSIE
jgi:hypothetical protein